MGCIFAKAKPNHFSNAGIRNIRIGINASNRKKSDKQDKDTVDGCYENDKTRPINGPHVTQGGSRDQNTCLSPRPPLTGPPTPNGNRQSMHVQYAEDLHPLSPLPDVISVATLQPSGTRASVTNINMKHPEYQIHSHRRHTMLSNNDVTIEDLDSELDQLSKYSSDHYQAKVGEMINPSITDVLLPRRKLKQNETKGSESNNTQKVSENVIQDMNGIQDKQNVKDKKKVSSKIKGKKKKKGLKIKQDILNSDKTGRQMLGTSCKTEEAVVTELKVNDVETESVKPVRETIKLEHTDKNTNHLVTQEKIAIEDKGISSLLTASVLTTSNEVVKTDATYKSESRIPSAKSLESSPVLIPKDIYQKELEKERLKRKRKHGQTRDKKQNYCVKEKTFVKETEKTDVPEEMKSGLKSRPGSVASVWTLESTNSFASQASMSTIHPTMSHMNAFSTHSDSDTPQSRFSYVPSGTTPLSFKQDSFDPEAQIVDLESENDLSDFNSDNAVSSGQVMDPFYGIKPYSQESEVLGKKITDETVSGASTSYLFTKQKLLYSRFARRPNSETYPRLEGKPPLPPGRTLKTRPASETNRGHNSFSRYFTTDLDIH